MGQELKTPGEIIYEETHRTPLKISTSDMGKMILSESILWEMRTGGLAIARPPATWQTILSDCKTYNP